MAPRDIEAFPEPQTPVVPVDEDGRVLLRAAEIIEERGWCQRDYGRPFDTGPLCATAALIAAGAYSLNAFNRRLGFTGGCDSWLTAWNDEDGRTKAEVLARLRSAAHATAAKEES